MTDRQFCWGLSNGMGVLAIAGAFWLNLGLGMGAPQAGWPVWSGATLALLACCGAILRAAGRLRRKSGFRPSELRQGSERQRAETRRIRVAFRWIGITQTGLVGLGVWLCVRSGREELIWPWIALIVSLHFLPLARLFHVRTYSMTGILGSLASFVALFALSGPPRIVFLGASMALVMWLSAAYLIWKADRIAAKAIGEPWAV